jgi:hypothetical protein
MHDNALAAKSLTRKRGSTGCKIKYTCIKLQIFGSKKLAAMQQKELTGSRGSAGAR